MLANKVAYLGWCSSSCKANDLHLSALTWPESAAMKRWRKREREKGLNCCRKMQLEVLPSLAELWRETNKQTKARTKVWMRKKGRKKSRKGQQEWDKENLSPSRVSRQREANEARKTKARARVFWNTWVCWRPQNAQEAEVPIQEEGWCRLHPNLIRVGWKNQKKWEREGHRRGVNP